MDYLKISEEVQQGLKEKKAIVALESTIISHGMPYPDNVRMALEVEALIRAEGAIPATIALLDGKICIGINSEEIERLGNGETAIKTSIRDVPKILASREIGATTVASTAYAAYLANIKFFATGGLGGVHRGAEHSFDISADLQVLADYDVCIVSSGVKSILDIPKTLEYLETLGVPVYGLNTDRYPGFYIQDSGNVVESVSIDQLAKLLKVKHSLKLPCGVSVGVPIPKEEEQDPVLIENTIQQALKEADQKGIGGKHVTPFLLAKIKEITEGKSLKSNIALMKNNAVQAAKIAVAYSKL